jgi:hypothetical protein
MDEHRDDTPADTSDDASPGAAGSSAPFDPSAGAGASPPTGHSTGIGSSPHSGHSTGAGAGAPFDLPVLDEAPELAALLEGLRDVDRLLARSIDLLIRLQDEHLAEITTGVSLMQWLSRIGRRTGADRRMLTTAATTCRRFPELRQAFCDGRVSWCQVRAIACKVHRLPREHDARIESELSGVLSDIEDDADPDDLARIVEWTLRDLLADPDPTPTAAPERDFLSMQPRLDGSGGTVYGDFGPAGFALLDACLNTGLQPDGRAKATLGADADTDAGARLGATLGRQRADRLLDLCRRATTSVPSATGGSRPGLTVLARVELDTLLGGDLPAQLLTHLTGGAVRVDAATARALAGLGADVRLIIHDHGRVVGVGRRTRQPPGWLRDAALAMHDTCSGPGCRTAARVCDLDHARPWHRGGATDVDNLAPLCATDNHDKEPGGWRCRQRADGSRTWHHPRSGLTIRTHPATWQPPASRSSAGSARSGGSARSDRNARNRRSDRSARGDPTS